MTYHQRDPWLGLCAIAGGVALGLLFAVGVTVFAGANAGLQTLLWQAGQGLVVSLVVATVMVAAMARHRSWRVATSAAPVGVALLCVAGLTVAGVLLLACFVSFAEAAAVGLLFFGPMVFHVAVGVVAARYARLRARPAPAPAPRE